MVPTRNTLVDLLPRDDARLVESICRPVELQLGEILQQADAPTRHVYFPAGAVVSLFATCNREPCVEVAMVGHEGMVGVQIALGSPVAPLTAIVQEGGTALRADARDFEAALGSSAALRSSTDRLAYVTLRQMAASTACLHSHQLAPRLARWLLMAHDRAGPRSLHVTQQFLAEMLGVRRVGITEAARQMQLSGLIAYSRGTVDVLDRPGLRVASCACHRIDRQLYASLSKRPSGPPVPAAAVTIEAGSAASGSGEEAPRAPGTTTLSLTRS